MKNPMPSLSSSMARLSNPVAGLLKTKEKVAAAPPGSLIFVGSQKMETPKITAFHLENPPYREEKIEPAKISDLLQESKTNWINLDGLHDTALVGEFGKACDLHPVMLDSILNTDDRPKTTDFDDRLLVAMRMLNLDQQSHLVRSEHICLILGPGYLLTFQEEEGDNFEPIRERIRNGKTRVPGKGLDYLLYRLLDAIINHYILVVEQIGIKVEQVEDALLEQPDKATLEEINLYKREMNFMAKVIRPARECMLTLARVDCELIQDETRPYLRDLVDLATHALDICDTYRIMLNDQLNIYHTNVSSRLNEMFRVLTIWSVVFVPITFIAGVYGMNFEFFPELDHPYAYGIFWGGVLAVVGGLLFYFKRKGWL